MTVTVTVTLSAGDTRLEPSSKLDPQLALRMRMACAKNAKKSETMAQASRVVFHPGTD